MQCTYVFKTILGPIAHSRALYTVLLKAALVCICAFERLIEVLYK